MRSDGVAGHRRAGWGIARAVGGVALAGLVAGAACTSEAICDGYETDGGECRAECDDSKCAPGHRCVLGDCRPTCEGQEDCPAKFNCLEAVADDGATRGFFCLQHGYAKSDSTGQDVPCESDAECDLLRGFTCRSGECRVWGCETHDDCKTLGACVHDPAFTDSFCAPDGAPRASGQYNSRCPFGDECDVEAGFVCRGAGEGDIEAYCTRPGCESDGDCPTGYSCATERAGAPCEDLCGFGAFPDNPSCTSRETFETPGGGWKCGPYSLLRNTCVKRGFCNPCDTDADCAALPHSICARDAGGNKICSTVCDENVENACPGGSASYCAVFDAERGVPTCSSRFRPGGAGSTFDACVGTGKACEPCREDTDCGADGLCLRVRSTGERFCMDLTFTCTPSATGSDCPDTPGGLRMVCLGDAQGLTPTDIRYRKCYPPNVAGVFSNKTSCWPLR